MKRESWVRISGIIVFLAGVLFIVGFEANIAAAVTGSYSTPTISAALGFLLILIGALLIIYAEDLEGRVITHVKGVHPVTKKVSHSPLYARVTKGNMKYIFQTDLAKKFGKGIKGGKAIVYRANDGKYHVAFMTECINTHHRHARVLPPSPASKPRAVIPVIHQAILGDEDDPNE